jgi:predicted transcriptional regulator
MAMDTLTAENGQTPDSEAEETEIERQDRFAWEEEGIAEARAELDAGLYVDADEMRVWVDSLRTAAPLPPPATRRL